MKRVHIFKSGTHTSAAGATLDFAEDRVKAIATGYDPKLHEAPLVIGHPKDNGPAYGWVQGIEFGENGLHAVPHQINNDFAEMLANNSFKKVSASFYAPDSPSNPTPGEYYLRHVGFLGAQPPAIKGLEPLEYNEAADDITVEFEEDMDAAWQAQDTAGIFRKLREFIIDKFTKEDADEVIPSYAIEGLERGAERRINKAINEPNYSEGNATMTPEEIAAMQAENAKLKQQNTDFSDRENTLVTRENAIKADARTSLIDNLVSEGKLLPAQKAHALSFMEALEGNDTAIEFAEGDATVSKTGPEAFAAFMQSFPKQVDFSERAPGEENTPTELTPREIADQARDFQEAEAAKGVNVTIESAVAHIEAQNS